MSISPGQQAGRRFSRRSTDIPPESGRRGRGHVTGRRRTVRTSAARSPAVTAGRPMPAPCRRARPGTPPSSPLRRETAPPRATTLPRRVRAVLPSQRRRSTPPSAPAPPRPAGPARPPAAPASACEHAGSEQPAAGVVERLRGQRHGAVGTGPLHRPRPPSRSPSAPGCRTRAAPPTARCRRTPTARRATSDGFTRPQPLRRPPQSGPGTRPQPADQHVGRGDQLGEPGRAGPRVQPGAPLARRRLGHQRGSSSNPGGSRRSTSAPDRGHHLRRRRTGDHAGQVERPRPRAASGAGPCLAPPVRHLDQRARGHGARLPVRQPLRPGPQCRRGPALRRARRTPRRRRCGRRPRHADLPAPGRTPAGRAPAARQPGDA